MSTNTLTGYALFRTLRNGDQFMLNSRLYTVLSVQWSYDYENQEQYCWGVEAKVLDTPNTYIYMKADKDDPTWNMINRVMPVETQKSSEPVNAKNTLLNMPDSLLTSAARVALQNTPDNRAVLYAVIKADGDMHGMPVVNACDRIITDIENAKERGFVVTLDYGSDPRPPFKNHNRSESMFMLRIHDTDMFNPDPEDMPVGQGETENTKTKHDQRAPITTLLNCSGVIPHRIVIYRKVRIVNVSVGAALSLQYGIISLSGNKRIVKRSMRSNGQYSQWELL